MRTAIVGGGIGGLITALLLSKRGFSVDIFEKENKLGGRLAFVEKDGYKIDEGPTIVLLPLMLERILDEAGISASQYELIRCDPLYDIHFPDGTTYTKKATEKDQLEEISRLFPGEEQNYRRFMTELKKRFELGSKAFLEKTFVNKRDFWTWQNIKALKKMDANKSMRKFVSTYFRDERLVDAYSLQSLYIGGNPYSAPAIYSLVPYSEHAHGIYYVKGGYASLVPLLEKALIEQGVNIHLNKAVQELSISGDKTEGVIVDEKLYPFDQVVLNGDFPNMAKIARKKEKKYVPSSSCLLLYLGLKRKYDHHNVHQYFMGNDLAKHMEAVFKHKTIPEDPAIYTFNPSVIDPSLAPEGKSVLYALIPVPSGGHIDWSNQQDFVDGIIRTLEEKGFEELRKKIEWVKVRTPNDAQAFGLYEGGSFGIAPELFQSGVFRPQYQPYEYKNVFAVGASIHPGGGVPIVMQGAKMLADHLIEQSSVQTVAKLS